MATLKQFYYKVFDNGVSKTKLPESVTEETFFDSELLLNGETTSKLSIQAPPGTEILINHKKFIVGRSGVLDIDNSYVTISSLIFPWPVIYIRENPDASKIQELEEELFVVREYLQPLQKMRILLSGASYSLSPTLTDREPVTQDTPVHGVSAVSPTVNYFRFYNNPTYYYSEANNFVDDWKTFCNTGLQLFNGPVSTTISDGFYEIAQEYLQVIQGQIVERRTDLVNVVINYIVD